MSKYIELADEGVSDTGKTVLKSVRSKSSGSILGMISWYGPWRQYVFDPSPHTTFSHDCLLSISRFCYSLNQQQRRNM